MRFVVDILKPRIVEVLKWMPFTSIVIIFEDNPRANRLIEKYFVDVHFQVDGKDIPAEFYFMPKSSGNPALEVADFIANAIGNQARFKQVDKMPGFRKDFKAIFHDIARKLIGPTLRGVTAKQSVIDSAHLAETRVNPAQPIFLPQNEGTDGRRPELLKSDKGYQVRSQNPKRVPTVA